MEGLYEMHEVMEDVIARAKVEHIKKIIRISIILGIFAGLNGEILKKYFSEESAGTVLEGAELEIHNSNRHELRLISFDCE